MQICADSKQVDLNLCLALCVHSGFVDSVLTVHDLPISTQCLLWFTGLLDKLHINILIVTENPIFSTEVCRTCLD